MWCRATTVTMGTAMAVIATTGVTISRATMRRHRFPLVISLRAMAPGMITASSSRRRAGITGGNVPSSNAVSFAVSIGATLDVIPAAIPGVAKSAAAGDSATSFN